ncbi:MAG: D-glycero-D-manno-heptose 1,7-bisphosphate phosphatase [Pseudohongiellaceae bacterium]|jgi:D-glycero-D-manno-heptose 1,7-bisphosphate phosphatase
MKIVILDRDGVINQDSKDYIRKPAEWIPIDGSIQAIVDLCAAGFKVFIATNQSGLARNFFSRNDLDSIHQKLIQMVDEANGEIHGIFYCPHLPSDHCNCRKPKTGLLEQIENKFQCSVKRAPFVGDSLKDVQAALAYGCNAMLVRTGNGEKSLVELKKLGIVDFESFSDLAAAAKSIISGKYD